MKMLMLFVAALALIGNCGYAALSTMDSAGFAFKYEMDVDPADVAAIDADGNGTKDFYGSASYNGFGVLLNGSGQAEVRGITAGKDSLMRGDYGGSLWRDEIHNNEFTIEWSVKIIQNGAIGEVANSAAMGVTWVDSSATSGFEFTVGETGQFHGRGTGDVGGTVDNTGAFHTFRIARAIIDEESGDFGFFAWRDGVLLNADMSTPLASNAGTKSTGSFFFGDYSSGLSGDFDVDFVRLQTGAYAPVPEPATMLLLGLGGLVLRRRRA